MKEWKKYKEMGYWIGCRHTFSVEGEPEYTLHCPDGKTIEVCSTIDAIEKIEEERKEKKVDLRAIHKDFEKFAKKIKIF